MDQEVIKSFASLERRTNIFLWLCAVFAILILGIFALGIWGNPGEGSLGLFGLLFLLVPAFFVFLIGAAVSYTSQISMKKKYGPQIEELSKK